MSAAISAGSPSRATTNPVFPLVIAALEPANSLVNTTRPAAIPSITGIAQLSCRLTAAITSQAAYHSGSSSRGLPTEKAHTVGEAG